MYRIGLLDAYAQFQFLRWMVVDQILKDIRQTNLFSFTCPRADIFFYIQIHMPEYSIYTLSS